MTRRSRNRNATRRSRYRSGSRRRVRRNKTMKGGMLGFSLPSIPGISREECKQSGYAFAIGSLTKGGNPQVPNKEQGTKLKQQYSTYYDTLGGIPSNQNIPVYTPNTAGDSLVSGGLSIIKKQAGNLVGAIPGATSVPGNIKSMLRPKDFNNIMDKITSDWINDFLTKRVLKSTNQELVDFGLSYTKMMEALNPKPSNTGATAAAGAVDKLKGFTGSAVSNMAGKLPGGLGSLFNK